MKLFLIVILSIIGLFSAYILLLIISSLFVDSSKEYENNSKYFRFLLNSATGIGLKIMRIKVHSEGIEKLPKNQRFLLICNHRSKFDPLVKWFILRNYNIAFISKESNFKVPVFGRFIRKCCFMKIDREHPKEAIKTINKASSLIKNGEVSVGVYPEGTRNYGKGLLDFHNGVLMIANKAECPVAVACIRGTEKIVKNYPWHGTDVYLDILETLPEEYAKTHRSNDIGEYAKKLISDKLDSVGENN